MDLLANEVRTKNLDHLGLVAATIDDLGIVEKIDAEGLCCIISPQVSFPRKRESRKKMFIKHNCQAYLIRS